MPHATVLAAPTSSSAKPTTSAWRHLGPLPDEVHPGEGMMNGTWDGRMGPRRRSRTHAVDLLDLLGVGGGGGPVPEPGDRPTTPGAHGAGEVRRPAQRVRGTSVRGSAGLEQDLAGPHLDRRAPMPVGKAALKACSRPER